MVKSFLIAYVSKDQKNESKVFKSFSKFKNTVNLENNNFNINRISIKTDELDYLTGLNPAIVIFDDIDEKIISHELIKKIKQISPLTHFIYFSEKYDKDIFLNVLKKEIEFCVSLDFFSESLFDQTLLNIFTKVLNINKLNSVIIWGNNISMNLINRKVWRSGTEIILTKNEFEILKFFLENQNTFFTKEQIFKAVWGYDEDVTGLVIQYIFKLKKKIGKENIINLPDDGYCFKVKDFNFN